MCNSPDTMSFFFVQIMEGGVLSGLLVNEIGGIPGILAWPHGVSEKKKKQFYLITVKKFIEDRKRLSKKVHAI